VSLTFRRDRGLARWLAAFVLLAWMAPWLAPHAMGDDPWCAPLEAASGTLTFRATVAGSDQEPHHCAICHSIRSFRTALSDCGPATTTLNAERLVAVRVIGFRPAPASVRLPARAPPA
jgi:hypothetical protein